MIKETENAARAGGGRRHRGARAALFVLLLTALIPGGGAAPAPERLPAPTFTNPLVAGRALADPWIAQKDGWYYFTFTAGRSIEIWKTRSIARLADAVKATVWRAPDTGPNVHDVWAPEIHFLRGRWYVYYTATDATRSDANRRLFVLEAETADPQGPYRDRGKISVPGDDHYAIDGTVYEKPGGKLYLLWSGREESARGPQNLYIAPMSDPWTISGPRVRLSTPTHDWEKAGWQVNEGPEVLRRGSKTHVVYSASGGTTPAYSLGLLTNTDGDLLNPDSWAKSPVPVFRQYAGPDGAVYGPGHNGFFTSPDGSEEWIVYHGKETPSNTWAGRLARAQRFYWNPDDTPNFGHPIPSGVRLAVPAGESAGTGVTPPPPAPRGTGTGLLAFYFAGPEFADPRALRKDPAVNFDWRLGAPSPGLPVDGFSARWRGQVQPRYSETYTFHAYADDGVRVWVNGKRIIDDWSDHAARTSRGTISLAAGRRYDIRVDYYDRDNEARLQLAWSSPSQPFEVIPRSQLYPLRSGVSERGAKLENVQYARRQAGSSREPSRYLTEGD